uniref:BTB domain-containing protein n=1 Tax=Ditylenchus dipsaci TaxID=166011 RepID=A0A915DQN7_9BILA
MSHIRQLSNYCSGSSSKDLNDENLEISFLLLPFHVFLSIYESGKAETSTANWHISCREQHSQQPSTDSALLVKLHCERTEANVVYCVFYKLTLIAKGAEDEKAMKLVKTGKIHFEPLDQWRALLRLDWSYLTDPHNMFFDDSRNSEIQFEFSVSKIVNQTFKDMTYSDGALDINGRLIFLLSQHSPVFDVMFNSTAFVESQQKIIKLEDVDYFEMLQLVDHVYQPTLQTLKEQVEYSFRSLSKAAATAIIQPRTSSIQSVSMMRPKEERSSRNVDFHQEYASYKCLILYLCMQPTYSTSDYGLLTEDNIRDLLKLADFYQINDLLAKCEKWLLEYEDFIFRNPEQLIELLRLAEKHNFSCLMEKCMSYSDVFLKSEHTRKTLVLANKGSA